MKKFLLASFITLGLLTIIFISSGQKLNQQFIPTVISGIPMENSSITNDGYEVLDTSITLAKYYRNVTELKTDADIIIEGMVKNTENVIHNGLPFTISEIEIADVFKSNNKFPKKAGTVKIIENGGIIDKNTLSKSFKEKFPNENVNENSIKPVKLIYDGIPQMTKGQQVIIFGAESYGITEATSYFVLGVYQGKFLIVGDGVVHTLSEKLKPEFEDTISTKQELIAKIKENQKY